MTVMAADSLGTAAGAPAGQRSAYENNGTTMNAIGNHGWSLDPPRLTPDSDRGTGDPGSLRTAVDTRQPGGRANTVFCDGHADALTPKELGYETDDTGRFIDGLPNGNTGEGPTNKYFSGDARDTNPPALPTANP
jgi:prepilin-type processing-associated H-X9-DG protein